MSTPTDEGWLADGSADAAAVEAYYDGWATAYDGDLDTWDYRAPTIVAGLVSEHAPDATDVLDAGCGTGLAGRALRSNGHTGTLVGVDLSVASLEFAGRDGTYTALSRVDLQQPLPFDDRSFDALMCVGVMTYVPDVAACWREFARVVKAGGIVAVTQRQDLWAERDTQGVVDRLEASGVWDPLLVTGPEPYLPGHDDFAGRIGVHYVAAPVR